MSRYFIKQKVFSWKDRFSIKDEQERDVYFVEGKLMSVGKKLHLYSIDGNEAVYIEQKFWRVLPEFDLFIGDKQLATIKKEFRFFKNDYSIHGPDWQIEGDFLGHDYSILEQGKVIADVTKRWLSWGDTYEIDIIDEAQEELLLGAVIVIDCVLAQSRRASNG